MQIDFSLLSDCSATLHIINPPGQPLENPIAVQVSGGTAFDGTSLNHGVENLGQYMCHSGQDIIALHQGSIYKYANAAHLDPGIVTNVVLFHAVAHSVIHRKHIDEQIWAGLGKIDRIENVVLLATWLFLQFKNKPEERRAFQRISDDSPATYQIWRSLCEEGDWDFHTVRAKYRKILLPLP